MTKLVHARRQRRHWLAAMARRQRGRETKRSGSGQTSPSIRRRRLPLSTDSDGIESSYREACNTKTEQGKPPSESICWPVRCAALCRRLSPSLLLPAAYVARLPDILHLHGIEVAVLQVDCVDATARMGQRLIQRAKEAEAVGRHNAAPPTAQLNEAHSGSRTQTEAETEGEQAKCKHT